ncbi:50S ribosomal protein L35 [Wolbachia endosymbiont of Dipetalonema caudispina]|uniref:50S ribosomal protein L35 n=1 Tax=Wolbachia endosymbiont of Dipetalonema caudispina TaxID=1812112 RepID=UPI001589D0B2|nr:50S ribosomal protein L35 [Wolbachia endosymbiont of Dipetalonema caudispina]MCV3769624.1 50S ribosomal protein L35 [Wolbachia pipientis]QKX01184.1 50S ribosomal protein L35 [Wolbachia endosymbiont of Dipetalonema caudispina]
MKKMKLKTKSSVKKRFNLTAKGKVISTQSGKRHGMIKRSKFNIRNQRGTIILGKSDSRIVKLYIPYGIKKKWR